MNTDSLKECPFCGALPNVTVTHTGMKFVNCTNCAIPATADYRDGDAIAAWNARHPSPQALIEELMKLLPDPVFKNEALKGWAMHGYINGVAACIEALKQHVGNEG